MAENGSKKKGPTPKAPQNSKRVKTVPTRVQASLIGASTGVRNIEGQHTFSFSCQAAGNTTVEVLWPLDVTEGIVESIVGTYMEACKALGIEAAQPGDYATTPEGVIDLSDVKARKRAREGE